MAKHSRNSADDWRECPSGTLRDLNTRLRAEKRRKQATRVAIPLAVVTMLIASVWSFGLVSHSDNDFGGITCHQVQEEMQAYLDGTLSEEKQQAFELHLANCHRCQELLREMGVDGQPVANDVPASEDQTTALLAMR